ncbi:hypothetical protein [Brevibacillus sp. SYSU BS000544]|uniref:hypothetical protein n=1 Tax=Brevibacillus sp. SYSU BS000544 TaxID=3416443 RepID=UPI003CE4A190
MTTQFRNPLAKISTFGITQFQQQNPYMVAWWSAIFPGFGHYLLNQYVRATLLTLSEVITNTLAHINEAMIYSFCGKFELAKSVLEPRWAFGYLTVYLIAIWDSYRSTIYQNKLCHLAFLENSPLPSIGLFPNEVQYLEKKRPFVAVIYSFFFPGLGQFYNHRFGLAFYAMFWWWIYLSLSHFHDALLTLALGNIQTSSALIHPHWFLFMPSVMGGSMYQAYITAIEHNRLYRAEQRQHLTNRYRHTKLTIFS